MHKKTQPSLLDDPRTRLVATTQRAENVAAVLRAALAAVVSVPRSQRPDPDEGEVWLTGRAEEVLAVVADISEDVRRGRISEEQGAASVDCYLDTMLAGVRQYAPRNGSRVASRYDTAPVSPEPGSPFTVG